MNEESYAHHPLFITLLTLPHINTEIAIKWQFYIAANYKDSPK